MLHDYEYFKSAVYGLTKIDLNAYKEKQMKRRIDALISKHGVEGYDKYIDMIRADKVLFDEFVSYLTINVSEFYRNPDQWKLLEQEIIPGLIEKFGKKLKIWSAACSTGDEPYSLVMVLSRYLPLESIRVYATDLDKKILEKARTGLYNEKSIENVPAEFREKYFEKVGPSYRIRDCIKSRVDFSEHNLLRDPYPGDCNLIVCRNVLIYFTEEAKDQVFCNFQKALAPGGILFIGSTEQVINYKEMGYTRKNSFYYEKV